MTTTQEKRKDDILIIGGGIIGLFIAYYLTESGKDGITIVERGSVASEASYGNAGGIWTNLSLEPRDLRLKQLSELSLQLFEELANHDGLEFEFRKNGVLALFPKDSKLKAVRLEMEESLKHGYDVSFLTPEEVIELEPEISKRIGGAIYSPNDANANCSLLALQIAEKLRERGVSIIESTEVTGMMVDRDRITSVETTEGKIKPRMVVNASGPWAPSIARMVSLSMPVEPAKGYMLSTKPQKAIIIKRAILNGDVVVTQRPNGVILMGGKVDFSNFDRSIDKRRVEEIGKEAIEMVPRVQDLEVTEKWTGFRAYTPDSLPIIGLSGRLRNLVYATGHFRRGFELAPATGEVVAELMTEGSSSLEISYMSPSRFDL